MTAVAPATGLRGPVVAGVVGKIAEVLTLALLALVVPRLLGPVGYGRFSVVLTLVALGSVAMTLGGATLLARYVPAAPADQRRALARELTLRLARNRVLPFAGLVVAGMVATAVAPHRFPPAATAWVLVALVLNVAATLALQADLGLGRAVAWSARYPVQNAVLVAAVLVLLAAGQPDATAAVAVAGVAGFALAAVATHRLWRPDGGPAVALPDGASRFGLAQAGGGALTQLAQRGGVVAVALFAGSAQETGFAAAAIGVALAATYAVTQVFTVALPALTARHTAAVPVRAPHGDMWRSDTPPVARHGDMWRSDTPPVARHGDMWRSGAAPGRDRPESTGAVSGAAEPALRRLAGSLLAVVLPAVAVGALALPAAVPLLLGPAYAGAVPAFEIALAAVVLAPLNALAVQAAALRLRPGVTLTAAAAGAVVFVATALAAVPWWGAAGAAGAALAGTATSAVVALAILPGAVGWRMAAASLGGAAAVTVWGLVA